MSQQKTIGKSVKLAVIIAVVAAVSAGTVFAVSQLTTPASTSQDSTKTPVNHTPTTDSGNVVIKGMRAKDNTNCVNPVGGPQIC